MHDKRRNLDQLGPRVSLNASDAGLIDSVEQTLISAHETILKVSVAAWTIPI
jgi:hypothetical protein